ncbi:butyrate kinase [bacterium]|nr:butyrate kinase [bacterium]
MDQRKKIIEAISEIGKSRIGLSAYERQLESAGMTWLETIAPSVPADADEQGIYSLITDLSSVVESLLAVPSTPSVNIFLGNVLSLLVEQERRIPRSKRIMKRLLNAQTAKSAESDRKHLLVVESSIASTKTAYFEGIERLCESEHHLPLDAPDDLDTRVEAVIAWLKAQSIDITALDGIACRGGYVQPVPTGTYRVVPEMLLDLEQPRIDHPSNMSAAIAMRVAAMTGAKGPLLITTSDPVGSDEIETVERLTGFIKIKQDGSGAHYLNHKAVRRMLATILGINYKDVNAITVHLGNAMSIALHRTGKITSIIDSISGVPSTNRSGPLSLQRILEALRNDEVTLKELEAITLSRGGLLSLAGTNDFRTLDAFRHKGATRLQQKKIDLIFDFFAREITSAALKLTADGKPIDFIALTGGVARSEELSRRIQSNIAGRYPLILVPGSIELESLAAGWLRGVYEPETIRDYIEERDALREKRQDENRLIDTVIFERKIRYRKKDAPIVSLDDLIDATCMIVKENFSPTIGIVGANNEEAILAAKRANEEGSYRIAKFQLLGDFAEISQIAYDFDLMIDNDNYNIVDTENPIDDAIKMLESNQVQVLMKGSVKTESILRGVFHFLKDSGKLKPGELISHVFVMDIPVRNKLLLISDAAVNTYPDEEKRIKIIENTLKVASTLNIQKPKVAVVSAIESVNLSIESSIVAERIAGHFAGRNDCIVEGPLSFDVAMDQGIAMEKHYKGQIRGNADILIMPDIDAGNVLYKSLTTQSGATAAGVILCGNMPLVLTSRGDSARSKLSSISLAVKLFFDPKQSQR